MNLPFHGTDWSCLNNYSTFDFHYFGIGSPYCSVHMSRIHSLALICFNSCYHSHFGHSDSSGSLGYNSLGRHCFGACYGTTAIGRQCNSALVDIRGLRFGLDHCQSACLALENFVQLALARKPLLFQETFPMMAAAAELACLCYLMCSSHHRGRMPGTLIHEQVPVARCFALVSMLTAQLPT